ncbi:MAG: carboxypeptidase regulatory-like domain-containing protein [Gemmatimonadaceae bacterium]
MRLTSRAVRWCAVAMLTTDVGAQELRGAVTLADGITPAVGVIIEAADSTSGAVIARALSSAQGIFILRLPAPGTIVVRGLRIGQRPTFLGTFALAAGDVRTERFTLSGAAVVLERVEIASEDVCRLRTSDGHQVATLFDEARKALRSTQLTSVSGRMVAQWVVENRLTTLDGAPLTEPTVQTFRASTDRPFVSLSPDSLAKVGYLSTEGETWIYQAPDADVLLSERFVEEHCFSAVPGRGVEADLVGIGFRPAPGGARGLVRIAGTLWLDRRTAELQRLDYSYVGVPRELAGTPAGGSVEFRQLPSGGWLVDRWTIRMPRPTIDEEQRFSGDRRGLNRSLVRRTMRITSMEVASGAVREVRRGGEVLYAAASAAGPRVSRTPAAVAALCAAPPGAARGVVWGVLRDGAGAAVPNAVVRVSWEEGHRWIAEWQRTWETDGAEGTTGADGFWIACGVPLGRMLQATAQRGLTRGRAITVVVPPEARGIELDLTLGTGAAPIGTVVVRGLVVDSLRTAAPWSGAEVQVLGTALRATTDATGRFEIAGVPPGELTIAVYDRELDVLRVRPPAQTLRMGANALSAEVVLATPSVATQYRALCSRELAAGEGMLVGEVRDLAGVRRAGVRVRGEWARMIYASGTSERDPRHVEAVTGADGWYVLCGLPLDGQAEAGGGVSVLVSGEFTLRAEGDGGATGDITMQLRGSGLVRRDLIVGGVRRARIGGRVIDQIGQPVADATVVLIGEDARTARTDSTGAWVMDSVPVRTSEIVVRALRFLPERRAIDPLGGRMTVGEIRLERAPQILAGQVITAAMVRNRAAFEFRRASGVGTHLDEGWIARHPTITVTTVRAAISKTRLVLDSSEGEFAVRYKLAFETDIGGGSSSDPLGIMQTCFPRWYVDGVDFGKPTASEEERLLRQAKRIEAYRAMEMPAGYIDFDGCGVILIWTYDL